MSTWNQLRPINGWNECAVGAPLTEEEAEYLRLKSKQASGEKLTNDELGRLLVLSAKFKGQKAGANLPTELQEAQGATQTPVKQDPHFQQGEASRGETDASSSLPREIGKQLGEGAKAAIELPWQAWAAIGAAAVALLAYVKGPSIAARAARRFRRR